MWYLYVMTALMAAALIAYIIFYNKEKKSHFAKKEEKFKKELDSKYSSLQNSIAASKTELQTIENDIQRKSQFNEQLHQMREEELDRLMEEEKNTRILQVKADVQDWAKSAQEAAKESFILTTDHYQKEIVIQQEQLKYIIQQLAEFKAKQDAVNEEILRRRALEEKQDFYRIQLTDAAKEDIHYLLTIIDNFHNKETIYKLIWSEYLQAPFKAMLNRVLNGKEYKNVIYMIQNINTHEVYIGKTRGEVSKRWTEHIKTSLNIGTISHANIHNVLFNHWDEFSFSVLETVNSEDKLSERERYYINFYESNICGYNIKSGG